MTAPILELTGIAHAFGGLNVLRDVSFSVPRGRIVGLIGPNGSGKTTLFNIASGFLTPQSGEIRLDSRPITGDSVPARSRAGLIRTFQTPKVFGHMSPWASTWRRALALPPPCCAFPRSAGKAAASGPRPRR
jgi:ABC-type branched-subunit amino acid transport system ATPase component